MDRTGKRRILKLADILEADAKSKKGVKFNLGVVVHTDTPNDLGGEVRLDCGTQACAMGLAALSGEFERAGLTYLVRGHAIEMIFKGQMMSFDFAAKALFGIKDHEVDFLFTPEGYNEKLGNDYRGAKAERVVAKRIRDFATGKVKAPKPSDKENEYWYDEEID